MIPLPRNFVEYLHQDGCVLPLEVRTEDETSGESDDDLKGESESINGWSDQPTVHNPTGPLLNNADDSSDSDGSDDETTSEEPSFVDLTGSISQAFKTLSTPSLFPKLDWSCPKDAMWLNTNSLMCNNPADVYKMLKGSDFIASDVDDAIGHSYEYQETTIEENDRCSKPPVKEEYPFTLTLRKYITNLPASSEYRVFVHKDKIIAVSQRDIKTCYPFLIMDKSATREHVLGKISMFWEKEVCGNFGFYGDRGENCKWFYGANNDTTSVGGDEGESSDFSNGESFIPCDCYVLDVFLSRTGRVWILDFNVWSERSETLLFSWSEIKTLIESRESGTVDDIDDTRSTSSIDFKLVETENDIIPDNLSSYRGPTDAITLASADTSEESKEARRQFKALLARGGGPGVTLPI